MLKGLTPGKSVFDVCGYVFVLWLHKDWFCGFTWKPVTFDLVPKGAHARGYALQLKIKHCWKLFLFKILCTCMNEWIYSTDNFSNQALVDFKIQSSHTEKAPKNDRQKRTSMYRVIFVTLLTYNTNKSQAHGEPITELYAENIVLYG